MVEVLPYDVMTATETTHPAVANVRELAEGAMRMVKVDGHRICLVRTAGGVHAVDHACPHEGYGLTQGELNGDLLTCAWHNWKFRVTDGACVQGEEGVTVHRVDVDETGDIRVSITRPDPAVVRARTLVSLRNGIAKDYTGQVARDVVRLLQASADPGELIWEAVAHGAPRAEFGWGHSIASATDCLSMVDLYEGDQRALPIVQGIVGIAESERDRPVNALPPPARDGDVGLTTFRAAVESERTADAQALVLAAIERGDTADELRRWFTAVVGDHLLSYGHGAIYAQKSFELLAMIGWERAATVLPHLVPTLVYGTREDKLPYMRPFVRGLESLDLASLAAVPAVDGWTDDGTLRSTLLGPDRRAALDATVAALRDGAGIDGVLDTVVHVVSDRMLRYDTAGEFDFADDFGWLDITHGLTYASAGALAPRPGDVTRCRNHARPRPPRVVHRVPRAVDRPSRMAHDGGGGTRGRAIGARRRRLRPPLAARLVARRHLGVHRPRPRRENEPCRLGRGGTVGLGATARCHGALHGGAEARAVRRGDGRAIDRLPQRSHAEGLTAPRSVPGRVVGRNVGSASGQRERSARRWRRR